MKKKRRNDLRILSPTEMQKNFKYRTKNKETAATAAAG